MAHYHFVQGTTAPFRFKLLEAGSPIDLLGSTVEILISDRTGTTVASPGSVNIVGDGLDGEVTFTPTDENVFDANDGPYTVRWKITNSGGDIYYVPSGARDIWNITGA